MGGIETHGFGQRFGRVGQELLGRQRGAQAVVRVGVAGAGANPLTSEGDAIAVRSMLNVCLSFDHRALDGDEVGAFLATLRQRLESFAE